MALSNFMVILDLTVANVSLPHISGDLGITLDQGAWVITSYAVAEAICVPLTGWLAARFGTVRVFIVAMLAFGAFSLVCGLSRSLGVLVMARIGQGLCGAPIMPITQALMLRVFPPERRAKAMVGWSMTVLLGPALGPIVGGYISDNFSWQWIFLINVPIAIGCTVVGGMVLRPVETRTERMPIDAVGLGLLVFWIGCLQIMLDIGRDHDWFGDWRIVALAVGAGIGFVAFVIWELTDDHPIVDLRIFRHRGFAVGVVALAVMFGAYFSSVVVLPQWLQSSQGYSAQTAGLVTAWTAMTSILTAVFMPRIVDKVDLRLLISIGTVWFVIQCFNRSGWVTGMDFWSLSRPQIIQGFGMSFFIMPLTQMALGAVEPREVAAAAGLQNFLRTIAVAVATSLILTDWGNEQRIKHNGFADTLNPDATVHTLSGVGFSPEMVRGYVNNLVDEQALTLAMDHTFMLSGIAGLLALGLVWLAPRPRPLVAMQAGH
ncbi:DHA2 family efflux MFS transporter permease subunit [Novosphingobium bradum]